MKTTKLNRTQKIRLKTMCVALGFDTVALGINNPMQDETPANWLEICARLFEKIVGYNHQKMGDMMYPFITNTRNPVDFLYAEYQKNSIHLQASIFVVKNRKKK